MKLKQVPDVKKLLTPPRLTKKGDLSPFSGRFVKFVVIY